MTGDTGGRWLGDASTLRVTIVKDLFSFSRVQHQVSVDGVPAVTEHKTGSVTVPVTPGHHQLEAVSTWPDAKRGPVSYGQASLVAHVPAGATIEVFYVSPVVPQLGSGSLSFTRRARPGYRLFLALFAAGIVLLIAQILVVW